MIELATLITYLIYVVLYEALVLGGFGYIVFWGDSSAWWFLLAVPLSLVRVTPAKWSELLTGGTSDADRMVERYVRDTLRGRGGRGEDPEIEARLATLYEGLASVARTARSSNSSSSPVDDPERIGPVRRVTSMAGRVIRRRIRDLDL